MDLQKHIIDTIKEWQLKIGYREGNMKLYYPGESLVSLLRCRGNARNTMTMETIVGNTPVKQVAEAELQKALNAFCDEAESQLGRIKITGSYERYCLDIPAKGCAYVAGKVPEPEFLKLFLEVITNPGSTMEQIRECFAAHAEGHGTTYVEDIGHAFYFMDDAVEEYVYWVEENEFGLTYHRFTKADYKRLK